MGSSLSSVWGCNVGEELSWVRTTGPARKDGWRQVWGRWLCAHFRSKWGWGELKAAESQHTLCIQQPASAQEVSGSAKAT